VTVAAALGQPPIFIRAGAALVLASATPDVKPHDAPARRLYLAAVGAAGQGTGHHFEDDGVSHAFASGDCTDLAICWRWDTQAARVELRSAKGTRAAPPIADWTTELPGTSSRTIHLTTMNSA
jgi:alpha-glucosidase (family GH31 glycosyl hydrolase)